MPSKQEMIDRLVGKLVGEFNELLAATKCGEHVNALKLQRLLNEISERSSALRRATIIRSLR